MLVHRLSFECSTTEQIAADFAFLKVDGPPRLGLLFSVFPTRITKTFYVLVSIRDMANPEAEGVKHFVTDELGFVVQYSDFWSCLSMVEDLAQACGLSVSDRLSVVVQVRP